MQQQSPNRQWISLVAYNEAATDTDLSRACLLYDSDDGLPARTHKAEHTVAARGQVSYSQAKNFNFYICQIDNKIPYQSVSGFFLLCVYGASAYSSTCPLELFEAVVASAAY
jgi:hypothetical protein